MATCVSLSNNYIGIGVRGTMRLVYSTGPIALYYH